MLVNRGKSQIYLTLNILLWCKVIEVNIVGVEAIYLNKYSCYFLLFRQDDSEHCIDSQQVQELGREQVKQ